MKMDTTSGFLCRVHYQQAKRPNVPPSDSTALDRTGTEESN
jgi:hypothetical protein